MRKTITDDDWKDWEVYLNGQRELYCVFADEEAGFILTCILDGENRIRGDSEGQYRRMKYGVVKLRRVNNRIESAASTIELLREENERYKKALEGIADYWGDCKSEDACGAIDHYHGYGMCEIARDALGLSNDS